MSGSTVFFAHYLIKGTTLKNVIVREKCFDFLYEFCMKYSIFLEELREI